MFNKGISQGEVSQSGNTKRKQVALLDRINIRFSLTSPLTFMPKINRVVGKNGKGAIQCPVKKCVISVIRISYDV